MFLLQIHRHKQKQRKEGNEGGKMERREKSIKNKIKTPTLCSKPLYFNTSDIGVDKS